jgi:hypothetical protein
MESPAEKLAAAALSVADSPLTPAEQARMAAMPRVPLFDLPVEPAKNIAAGNAVEPGKTVAVEKAIAVSPAPPAQIQPQPNTSLKPETPVAASPSPKRVLVSPPKPFAWEKTSASSGNRPFLTASIGEDGYRTLVVGSVGGNDPVALQLIDLLAHHLQENSVIMGGFESTIIRTLNPDGEANRTFLNQKEQYINHSFPSAGQKPAENQPAEVTFLLEKLQQLQPQRVVHIRTVPGNSGLIAASTSCQSIAKEAADWLKFKQVNLPEKAVAGSMERYVSTEGNRDMITLAIPDDSSREELWSRYGDTLLNLLLGEDFATREIARKQAQQSSADRRNQSPGK